MNRSLAEIQANLRSAPDNMLPGMFKSGDVPQFMVMLEKSRRDRMRQAAAAGQPSQPPMDVAMGLEGAVQGYHAGGPVHRHPHPPALPRGAAIPLMMERMESRDEYYPIGPDGQPVYDSEPYLPRGATIPAVPGMGGVVSNDATQIYGPGMVAGAAPAVPPRSPPPAGLEATPEELLPQVSEEDRQRLKMMVEDALVASPEERVAAVPSIRIGDIPVPGADEDAQLGPSEPGLIGDVADWALNTSAYEKGQALARLNQQGGESLDRALDDITSPYWWMEKNLGRPTRDFLFGVAGVEPPAAAERFTPLDIYDYDAPGDTPADTPAGAPPSTGAPSAGAQTTAESAMEGLSSDARRDAAAGEAQMRRENERQQDYFNDVEARIRKKQDRVDELAELAKWDALARAGIEMMGAQTPYGSQAIAAGLGAGLESLRGDERAALEAESNLLRDELTIAEARQGQGQHRDMMDYRERQLNQQWKIAAQQSATRLAAAKKGGPAAVYEEWMKARAKLLEERMKLYPDEGAGVSARYVDAMLGPPGGTSWGAAGEPTEGDNVMTAG